jgi:hypothetical protein
VIQTSRRFAFGHHALFDRVIQTSRRSAFGHHALTPDSGVATRFARSLKAPGTSARNW